MQAITPQWPDYRELNSALARDMCWLLDPLFNLPMPDSDFQAFRPHISSATVQWLIDLDQNQEQLGKEGKLGQYFEDLVAYYLHHRVVGDDSLQRNVPLRRPALRGNGVETLGELDFLYLHQQQWQHLEVAVKFYFGVDNAGQRLWIGPNSRDRLDKKCLHMLLHQLPLAQLFTQHLPIESCYWLKGILFEPWHSTNAEKQPFTWLYQRQIEAYFEQQCGTWALLPKRGWLGTPSDGAAELDTQSLCQQLKRHFQQVDYGVMVTKRAHGDEQRCFVVADSWPGAAGL